MTMVESKIKNWGNSFGVIIPKEVIKHEKLHEGDIIKIDIIPGKKVDAFGLFKGIPKFEEEKETHEEF
jgi:antitoxin component of MazEF toxin-antitoxin module